MTRSPVPFHPLRALAALVATAAALHGAGAWAGEADDTDPDEPAHVHVVGRHLALRTACPDVDEELPDELLQAWRDQAVPAVVPVEFKLRGDEVFDVQPATDSPRLARQLRRAMRALSCDSHDDAIHTVDLVVRFIDPASLPEDADDDDTRVAIEAAD